MTVENCQLQLNTCTLQPPNQEFDNFFNFKSYGKNKKLPYFFKERVEALKNAWGKLFFITRDLKLPKKLRQFFIFAVRELKLSKCCGEKLFLSRFPVRDLKL